MTKPSEQSSDKTPVVKKTTIELAQEKADQLTEEYKSKGVYMIHPIVFKDPQTDIEYVGYIKEPSRGAKMAVLDKSVIGSYGAAEEIVESVLLKEYSDPAFYSEDQKYDSIHIGLVKAVLDLIKIKQNTAKKK